MRKTHLSFMKYVFMICLCLGLCACSKYTQENFDKIQPGMTMQQVTTILGEPSTSQSVTIAGISGTSATWQDKNTTITIQFLDNKVQIKTLVKSSLSDNQNPTQSDNQKQ